MLPTLLLGLVGGGLVASAVLPATAAASRPVSAAVTPTVVEAGPPWVLAAERDEQRRATRDRQTAPTGPASAAVVVSPVPPEAVSVPPAAAPAPPPVAPVLPGCSGKRPDAGRPRNGQLPTSALCVVPGGSGERLRPDAAVAFTRLAGGYQEHFGTPICVTDGYRTLGEQQQLRRAKPGLSARPGTSEHGWGLAVDLACGVQSFRSEQHAWLVENARTYGWVLPTWAQRGGSKPEPWHWEFVDP